MAKKNQDLILQDRKWKVYKSNDLIQRSRYSLPINQQRMLLFMISKISNMDSANKEYTFSIPEFCQVAGIKIDVVGTYYTLLKQQLKQLADSSAWIRMEDGKEVLFRWINTMKIEKGSSEIKISFHETVQPYLFDLHSNYTQYRLQEILPYKSKYSIRLYELLKSYAFGKDDFQMGMEKEISYTPDEIRIRLDAENYTKYRDLKQRAILPAVEEINRYSEEIHIRIEEVKTGNKVTQILFLISYAHARQVLEARENRSNRLD